MLRLIRVARALRAVIVPAVVAALIAFPLGVLASHSFSDVPTNHPFHADIAALKDSGVSPTGCGGGKFCPDDFVTRGQMAAFLNRLGALGPGKVPVANADKLDGLDSTYFAAKVPEAWHEIGAPGEPAFAPCGIASGWINFDPTTNSAAYYKDPIGVVHLKGFVLCVGGATAGDPVFQLPAGNRPAKLEVHATVASNALARVDIHADGVVRVTLGAAGAGLYLSLDGITFRAAP